MHVQGSTIAQLESKAVVSTYLNFVMRLFSPVDASKLFGCLFLKVELVMLDSHDDEVVDCL